MHAHAGVHEQVDTTIWVYMLDAYACEARDVHADVKNADARVNGGRAMCIDVGADVDVYVSASASV